MKRFSKIFAYAAYIAPVVMGVILFFAMNSSAETYKHRVCIQVYPICTSTPPCPTFTPDPCPDPTPEPSPTPTPGPSPSEAPPPGGGGGGGSPPQSQVIVSGRAFPKSAVTLLKDAQIVASTIADSNANFRISLTNVTSGSYIFSLYSEDSSYNRSSLFSFPAVVTQGVLVDISNIFLAPLISTDKSEVRKGEKIGVLGKTVPDAEVTIMVGSEEEVFAKVRADNSGSYLHYFDTLDLSMGQHSARSQSYRDEEVSPFSKSIGFIVGTRTIFAKPQGGCGVRADVNNDCRINLVDFSVAAYWYRRTSPPAHVDINSDGMVSLIDFSIMAYYWTG